MTYPTEAALAALAANGHEPKRMYGSMETKLGFLPPPWIRENAIRWLTPDGGVTSCPDDDDARNAVRCAMLDRLAEADGCDSVEVVDDGSIKLWHTGSPCGEYPDLLAAYRAVCGPGETAADESLASLRDKLERGETVRCTDGTELKGGAMATNEEMYEAMVARGDHKDVPSPDTEYVTPTNLSRIYTMRQLEALAKAGCSGWAHAPTPEDVWKAYQRHFLPSQPEPSAAEELAEALRAIKDRAERIRRGEVTTRVWGACDYNIEVAERALARYDAATAGGR